LKINLAVSFTAVGALSLRPKLYHLFERSELSPMAFEWNLIVVKRGTNGTLYTYNTQDYM